MYRLWLLTGKLQRLLLILLADKSLRLLTKCSNVPHFTTYLLFQGFYAVLFFSN